MTRKRRSSSRRIGRVEREMLTELSLGDVMYGFFLSAGSSHRLLRLARERAQYRYHRKLTLERLVEKGFLTRRGEMCSLSPSGKRALGVSISRTKQMLGKRRWDKKWRIVAFDIPQKHSGERRRIRGILRSAGFVKMQQSIWVFPHECQELIDLLKEETALAPHILYGVLDRIENDSDLRRTFKL